MSISQAFRQRIDQTNSIEDLKEELSILNRIYSEDPKSRRESTDKINYILHRIQMLEKQSNVVAFKLKRRSKRLNS